MRSANRAIRRKVRLPKRQLIGSCPRGSKNWWGVKALGGRRCLGQGRYKKSPNLLKFWEPRHPFSTIRRTICFRER
jgi:hypothetical protein